MSIYDKKVFENGISSGIYSDSRDVEFIEDKLPSTAAAAVALSYPDFFDFGWRADSLSLNDEDAVSAIIEIDGGASLLQAGVPQPVYKATENLNRPSVLFTPTDYMDAAIGTLAQPNTLFLVATFNAVAGCGIIDTPSGGRNHVWIEVGTPTRWALYAGSQATTVSPATSTGYHVITAQFSGTASWIQVEATRSSALSAGIQSMAGYRLGANQAGAAGCNIYWEASFVSNAELTDEQIAEGLAYIEQEFPAP